MICDCHFHTDFSADSETPIRAQIDRAISLGMKEICVTDHYDYGSGFCGVPFVFDIPAYLHTLKALKEEYRNRIRINTGIELGLMNREADFIRRFPQEYGRDFDFVIGSSHFLGDSDPYYPEFWAGKREEDVLASYFKQSLKRIENLSDSFDSYGHLDYIVRYSPNKNTFYSYEKFSSFIDPILKVLIERGKALECNTGGFKYGLREPNPCASVLKRYRELGGELITVGSDAHEPKYLGYEFERCREMLLECGFQYYTVYHERKPEFYKL